MCFRIYAITQAMRNTKCCKAPKKTDLKPPSNRLFNGDALKWIVAHSLICLVACYTIVYVWSPTQLRPQYEHSAVSAQQIRSVITKRLLCDWKMSTLAKSSAGLFFSPVLKTRTGQHPNTANVKITCVRAEPKSFRLGGKIQNLTYIDSHF